MRSIFFLFLSATFLSAESFPAANGLERTLVASEPFLKNPISISVDVDGTIYVTETQRRKLADLDIRNYYDDGWVPHDVSHTSIEDKLNFFKEKLDGSNKLVNDLNGDGVHDIRDLTALSEKIHQLKDTDGDGVIDRSTVFAGGFNTEVTGIAAGTLAWRGDIYATIAPDVWKMQDTDGDGKADKRESLAYGFGVHIAYGGHDMHGLTLGPDGRIYWTIGDKGVNVTSREGKNFFAPHEGAVLSINPDGSDFKIFARGLRNPQEIAFDQHGNIFSVDNDADQKGERERFVHIVEGSDSGWRNYYQYRGNQYNPWMEENLWELSGKYQPAYILPPLSNYSDGPAGFAFNPGTALNETYKDAFFVTEFPKGNLRSFKVKPKGASYEMTDEHVVLSGPMNIGINFGPDGALYSVDWSGGYPLNEKGAVWKTDDPKVQGSNQRKEVAAMLLSGPGKTSVKNLVERLYHPDMRIRSDAQWELAKRGKVVELEGATLSKNPNQLAKIHGLWGLSQLNYFSEKAFLHLLQSADPELRAQALLHAGKTAAGGRAEFLTSLEDANLRVRFQAAMAIWRSGMPGALPAVMKILAENDGQENNLRHAGVLALTIYSAEEILKTAASHENDSVRLAAAVALRRLSSPLVADLLVDSNPRIVTEAAGAIHDDPAIPEAFPALAALLEKNPLAMPAAIRRSIAANRRAGDSAAFDRLIAFSQNKNVTEKLRIAALEAMATWDSDFKTDLVDGRHHPYSKADVSYAKTVFEKVNPSLQKDASEEVQLALSSIAATFGILASDESLIADSLNTDLDSRARARAIRTLSRKSPEMFQKIFKQLLSDPLVDLRIATVNALFSIDPKTTLDHTRGILENSKEVIEKQNALRLLGSDSKTPRLLTKILKEAMADPTKRAKIYEPGILLELMDALTKKDRAKLEAALKSSAAATPHYQSLEGGDVQKGSQVFNQHLAAQCTACHRVEAVGSEVGPPLTEVGKKSREYILESLVSPQEKLTPGYGLMSIQTKSGVSVNGAFMAETGEDVTVLLADKTQQIVKKSEITNQSVPLSTMPPMSGILTDYEIRDLVAYLNSLK